MKPLLGPLVLFAATVSFTLGMTLPLMRLERLWLFSDEPSLLGIVAGLWNGGDILLAAIVALASIGFPTVKLALLHITAYGAGLAEPPAWLRFLASWSMLDVMLVALVIFAAKTSGVATAFTQPGLWFFAAAALLTIAASALLGRPPQE